VDAGSLAALRASQRADKDMRQGIAFLPPSSCIGKMGLDP
jgi:hypothetical protein